MGLSTRALRRGLVVCALLLIAVVIGFIGYARYRANRFLAGLPEKLGIHITQETDNFTYSQSLKGKTIFTVHASKEIQRNDGKITLKDVGIVLYGRKADRADRIHGNEFEYDQKNGVLRAVGDAFIDLSAPAAKPGAGAMDLDSQSIHVKTNGLVFLQKERTAATDGLIEFAAGGLSGKALGASYDSGTGVVVLRSAVHVSGLRGEAGKEHPVVLTAARAEMDRDANVVLLDGPKYVATGSRGAQTLAADRARVHLSAEGAPERVEADGHVELEAEGRAKIAGERLEAELAPSGRPRRGHLWGGVRLTEDTKTRTTRGQAADARVTFDSAGNPAVAAIAGGVQVDERAGTSERRLNAERVDLTFAGGGKQPSVLRSAVASGPDGARIRTTDARPAVKDSSVLGVRADVLKARFTGSQITGLDGSGKTRLERVNVDQRGMMESQETSSGDVLTLHLKTGVKGRMELLRASQRGSVQTQREVAAVPGGVAQVEHARADSTEYEADADLLTLRGAVEIDDAQSAIQADQVRVTRGTGDATAEGNVRVSYMQPGKTGPGEPVHVLAAKAVARKATGLTVFTAAAGARVRMWAAGSQIEAPVLELNRAAKTLFAYGPGAGANVRAILAAAPDDGKARQGNQAPMRVLSQQLRYNDATRQADFRGQVHVERDGTMRSQHATVFLAPSAGGTAAQATTMMGGQVDHVVAEGGVELTQPGRTASGERLVYVSADRTFTLTGTKAAPPRLTDEARGMITGASLRFRSGDDSVVISGGETGSGPGRVRTEMTVRQ